MSKLPVVSSKDLIKFLVKKGFRYERTTGSHHVYKLNDRLVSIPERKEVGKKSGSNAAVGGIPIDP